MKNWHAPNILAWDKERGLNLTLRDINVDKYGYVKLDYQMPFSTTGCMMSPQDVEESFGDRDKRPDQEIVTQGKYECMPAALAMATGHSLFTIKRTMGRFGWRNDNRGAVWEPSHECIRALGFEMIYLNRAKLWKLEVFPTAVMTVPSLNLKGRAHAITWLNGEMLDPNWGYPGRKIYGKEWHPLTVNASGMEILLKPMSRIQYEDLLTMSINNDKDLYEAIEECAL